jgi:hypothetical protein
LAIGVSIPRVDSFLALSWGFSLPFTLAFLNSFFYCFSRLTVLNMLWFSVFSFEKSSDPWISARFPNNTICIGRFCPAFSVSCYWCFANTTSMYFCQISLTLPIFASGISLGHSADSLELIRTSFPFISCFPLILSDFHCIWCDLSHSFRDSVVFTLIGVSLSRFSPLFSLYRFDFV